MTFGSVEELNYVRSELVVERSRYEEHIWVGASDLETENIWVWITGGRVSPSFWRQGEPNNDGIIYVYNVVFQHFPQEAESTVPCFTTAS